MVNCCGTKLMKYLEIKELKSMRGSGETLGHCLHLIFPVTSIGTLCFDLYLANLLKAISRN